MLTNLKNFGKDFKLTYKDSGRVLIVIILIYFVFINIIYIRCQSGSYIISNL